MTSDDDISDESRLMAARVRERASRMPHAADLAGMAIDAPRGAMTADEMRQLATEAIEKAERLSFLLGKLAGLVDDPPPAGER